MEVLDDLGLRVMTGPGWGLEAKAMWLRLSVKKKQGPEAWVSMGGGRHQIEGMTCQIKPTMEGGKQEQKLRQV